MAVTCPECKKKFCNTSNLNRHRREQHGEKNGENRRECDKKVQCELCGRMFKRKEHLQIHIDGVHLAGDRRQCPLCNYETVSKSSLVRHIKCVHKKLRLKSSEETEDPQFACSSCPKKFRQKKHLNFHLRNKHDSQDFNRLNIKKSCPLCSFTANHSAGRKVNQMMYDHFRVIHDLSMDVEMLEFNSMSEFDCWKSNLEKESATKFNRSDRHATKRITFICHRSGNYQSKGSGKRLLKKVGSCKLNGFCPAAITANIKDSGYVKVTFLNTHVGHRNDLEYIFLPPAHRKVTPAELTGKVPYEDIQGEMQGDLTDCDLKRFSRLTTREDIFNIEKIFNLTDDVTDPFHTMSVEVWAREFGSSNESALLFYKPQGTINTAFPDLHKDDFLLLFMTDAQKQLCMKYGGDIVCVDGTQDAVNSSDVQLHALLVMDNKSEGIPVAFMFSNRADELVMKVFFEKIKETVGPIPSHIFMSNMDEAFYNAWSLVMGKAKLPLYCAWHVLKTWKKIINVKIKVKEKKEEVYKVLQTLLCELDSVDFLGMLETNINKWSKDEHTVEFADYFSTYYVDNNEYKKWASSCRIEAGINTNMAVEHFNELLKYCNLRGKGVKRLDKTLGAVLKLLQDKLFHILIKIFNEKTVSKQKILRKRHIEGFKLGYENVFPQEGGGWQVISPDCNQFYSVKQVQSTVCVECPLQCYHCKSCFHQYMCSCVDHGIKNNMCKHIHMVAKFVINTVQVEEDLLMDEEFNRCEVVEVVFDTPHETEAAFQNSASSDVSKDQNNCEDFEEAREHFAQELIQIIRNDICNFEELKAIQEHCKSIKPILKSMKAPSS